MASATVHELRATSVAQLMDVDLGSLRAESPGEEEWRRAPHFVVLGIASSSGAAHAAQRQLQRRTWMNFETPVDFSTSEVSSPPRLCASAANNFARSYLLPLYLMPATAPASAPSHDAVGAEARQHRDMLFLRVDSTTTTATSANDEGGTTHRGGCGAVRAALMWLAYAYAAFPSTTFVAKSVDAAYITAPYYVHSLLLSHLTFSSPPRHLYIGGVGFSENAVPYAREPLYTLNRPSVALLLLSTPPSSDTRRVGGGACIAGFHTNDDARLIGALWRREGLRGDPSTLSTAQSDTATAAAFAQEWSSALGMPPLLPLLPPAELPAASRFVLVDERSRYWRALEPGCLQRNAHYLFTRRSGKDSSATAAPRPPIATTAVAWPVAVGGGQASQGQKNERVWDEDFHRYVASQVTTGSQSRVPVLQASLVGCCFSESCMHVTVSAKKASHCTRYRCNWFDRFRYGLLEKAESIFDCSL